MFFFHGYHHSMFYTKNTCTTAHRTICMVIGHVRPGRLHGPWATTRVKRVDMLYLGAYTQGGRCFAWALVRAFTVDSRKLHEVTQGHAQELAGGGGGVAANLKRHSY